MKIVFQKKLISLVTKSVPFFILFFSVLYFSKKYDFRVIKKEIKKTKKEKELSVNIF